MNLFNKQDIDGNMDQLTEIEFANIQIADLKAKVSQATTFLQGLNNTPDNTTIGELRSFIEANYNNITKIL